MTVFFISIYCILFKLTGSGSSKGGLRAEMEGLRSHFDMTDSNRTPLGEETLRQFYRYVVVCMCVCVCVWCCCVIKRKHIEVKRTNLF